MQVAGERKAREHRYHHVRRWNVSWAVGRANLEEGRREICYFTGTLSCKWGQGRQDGYRQTEQPGVDLTTNAPPNGHERALIRSYVNLGKLDSIVLDRYLGNGPGEMDPQP